MTDLPTRLRADADAAAREASRWRWVGINLYDAELSERVRLTRDAADEIERLHGSRSVSMDEAEANARLIASASCMLEALRAMDEALTAAWGDPDDGLTRERLGDGACDPWSKIRSALARAEAR